MAIDLSADQGVRTRWSAAYLPRTKAIPLISTSARAFVTLEAPISATGGYLVRGRCLERSSRDLARDGSAGAISIARNVSGDSKGVGMQNNTSERILDSAHSLMARLGYAGFSYADIAEIVGISKASIHHHFATKAELAVAVLIRHRTGLLAGAEAIDRNISVPLKRLRAYAEYWEGCIEDGTRPFCVAALLAAELPGLPEEVAAELQLHFQGLRRWIRSTLEAGVKDRTIRLRDSLDVEAEAFMATMHGALLSARVSGTCDVFRTISASTLKKLAAPRKSDRSTK